MKLLFIGNSHTFANGLPYQVREMINASAGREECQVAMCASGGRDLAWHAQESQTLLAIGCNRWDCVVLQQKSHEFAGYAELAAGYSALEPRVQACGAAPLLFVTWKRKDAPDSDQETLDLAFARLALEKGARLVPVGAAWRAARQAAPEIELYSVDGAHASPAGTYLSACVFFRVLTGKSPVGLPGRIVAGQMTLADLSSHEAGILQRVAADLLMGV